MDKKTAAATQLAKKHGFTLRFGDGNLISLNSDYGVVKIAMELDDVNDGAEVLGAVKGAIASMEQANE